MFFSLLLLLFIPHARLRGGHLSFGMLNYFLLLAVFAIFFQIYGYNEPRIQNGVLTPPNFFQFVVKVRSGGCTGTVISKRHVLTAAHCINEKGFIMHERYQEVEHRFNIDFREEDERINYTMKNGSKGYIPIVPWKSDGNDIAIIEYEEGTNLGLVPVKLAKDYIEKDGDDAYITGFGAWWEKDNKSSGASKVLRHANITMTTKCYGTLIMCGGNKTYHSLGGDSGGPLFIYRNNQWYQIGVSHGHFVDRDIRTRISSYCNFIEEVTKNEVKCESIYPENYFNGQMLPIKHFEPIYKGQSTPLNAFDFVVPLYNYYYNQGCTATVISKRHLLTAAWCVYQKLLKKENKNIKITQHGKSYKKVTGKLFPDFRAKDVHPNLNNNVPIDVTAYFPNGYMQWWAHNLAVIEFPDGTDFGVEPVTLAKDHFEVYMEEGIIAGYGIYEISNDMHMKEPPILQHSYGILDNIYKKVHPENENLLEDEGGPTLIERNGKLFQMGVYYCHGPHNGSHAIISNHCDFIEEITKNEVKCESILPIYEKPPSESTATMQTMILPSNEIMPSAAALINTQKPSNISPKINQFQMELFLIALLFMFFCV